MFPIRKTSDFHQYFHRSRKIRKSGSTKLYDITTFKKQFFFKIISVITQKHVKYLLFSKMSKVTDSDNESDSSDIESLLSFQLSWCRILLNLLLLRTMKIVTLRKRFSSKHPAIVKQGIVNGVNAIIVNRWRLMLRVFVVQKQMKSTKRCLKVN